MKRASKKYFIHKIFFAQTSNGVNFLEYFSKYQKATVVTGVILALASFIDKNMAIGGLLILFLSSLTLLLVNKFQKESAQYLSRLFLIIFFIHIIVVAAIHYTGFQPFSGGRGDYTGYDLHAKEISSRIQSKNFSISGLSLDHYYPVVVGYMYFLTAPSPLMGQLFNAWLVALTCGFVFLIVRQLAGSAKQGFVAGVVTGFYPSLFFYGSLLLKDALVVFFAIVGLFFVIQLVKTFSVKGFLLFYIVVIVLTHFRFYIGYVLIFTFIISWFLFSSLAVKKRLAYGLLMVLLLGFIPDIAMVGLAKQGYFGINNIKAFSNPGTIVGYREQGKISYSSQFQQTPSQAPISSAPSASTTPSTPGLEPKSEPPSVQPLKETESLPAEQSHKGNSSINVDTIFNGPLSFLKNILKSLVYVVLGPFPWQLTQKRHLFTLMEMIPWYFLLFFIVKGIAKTLKTNYKTALPPLIFCFSLFLILSFYISNFGITTRIRMPAFVALFCFFPFGLINGFSNKLLSIFRFKHEK